MVVEAKVELELEDIPVVCDYLDVFVEAIGLPLIMRLKRKKPMAGWQL